MDSFSQRWSERRTRFKRKMLLSERADAWCRLDAHLKWSFSYGTGENRYQIAESVGAYSIY